MLEEVDTEYFVNENDFIHFQLASVFNWKVLAFLIFFIIVIFINTIGIAFLSNLTVGFSISNFIPILVPFLIFGYVYWRSRSSFRKHEYFHNPMYIRLLPNRVQFRGQDYNSIIGWNKVHKLIEKKNYFLFYSNKRIANIVSKSSLTDEDIDRVRDYIEQFPELKKRSLDLD